MKWEEEENLCTSLDHVRKYAAGRMSWNNDQQNEHRAIDSIFLFVYLYLEKIQSTTVDYQCTFYPTDCSSQSWKSYMIRRSQRDEQLSQLRFDYDSCPF